MVRLTSNPKILITTSYKKDKQDIFDSATVNIPRLPRFSWPTRTVSAACRFIKQNVPEIEVMEYPSWPEYTAKLAEGWDVVGFTGFNYELVELEEMAHEARRQGIREIWSGSYMALSPEAEAFSDKVWLGYAEDSLAELFGRKIARIKHPPVLITIRVDLTQHISIPYKIVGGLFTQRGCAHKCTFCQAPAYCPRPYRLSIESVEEILRFYNSIGIDEVAIGDENFGQFREHSERVVDILERYGMRWWVDSRAELISRSLDDWVRRGLSLTVYGVESVRASILDKMRKGTTVELINDLEARLGEKGVFSIVTYMLGHEDDTPESILEDLVTIKKIGFDVHQITVLTPFPKTQLWNEVQEKYGIFDRNPKHYDTRHLVWNHPNISPRQMHYLLQTALGYLNVPFGKYGIGMLEMALRRIKEDGISFPFKEAVKPILNLKRQLKLGKKYLPFD